MSVIPLILLLLVPGCGDSEPEPVPEVPSVDCDELLSGMQATLRNEGVAAALVEATQAMKTCSGHPGILGFYASCQAGTRHFPEALEAMDRLLGMPGVDGGNLRLRAAQMAFDAGDYEYCVRKLEPIRERLERREFGGRSAGLLHMLAIAAQKSKVGPDAVEVFTKLVELDPENRTYLGQLGSLLVDGGKFEEAMPHLRKVTSLHPDYRIALETYAICLDKMGRRADALPWYRLSLEKDVQYRSSALRMALCCLSLGGEHLEEAGRTIEVALKHRSGESRVSHAASSVYRALGDDEKSEKFARLYRQQAEQEREKSDDIRRLRDLARNQPHNVEASVKLIQWYFDHRMLNDAHEEALRIVRTAPTAVEAIHWLGTLFVTRKEFGKATWEARKLIEVDPHDHRGPALLAWSYWGQKNWSECAKWGEEALARNATHGRTVKILVDAYQALGNEERLRTLVPLLESLRRKSP